MEKTHSCLNWVGIISSIQERHIKIHVRVISDTFLLSLVLKESTCWRSHAAQMLRTWLPIHASYCRSALSSANWTRWSATWHQWVSCRWLHDHGPARRRTSWHPGKTCRYIQYAQELPRCYRWSCWSPYYTNVNKCTSFSAWSLH